MSFRDFFYESREVLFPDYKDTDFLLIKFGINFLVFVTMICAGAYVQILIDNLKNYKDKLKSIDSNSIACDSDDEMIQKSWDNLDDDKAIEQSYDNLFKEINKKSVSPLPEFFDKTKSMKKPRLPSSWPPTKFKSIKIHAKKVTNNTAGFTFMLLFSNILKFDTLCSTYSTMYSTATTEVNLPSKKILKNN